MRALIRLVVVCVFSSTLIMCMTACSGFVSTPPPTHTPLPRVTMNYAVADQENNRVLIYNTPFSTDESASVVLGQADFTHGTVLPIAANTMDSPFSVAVDSSSNLYVADNGRCRVLQYKPPYTNGMSASAAIGEPDFVTQTCTDGASTLGYVMSIAIDGYGDLWVSDTSSHIVEFVPPFSTGMSATLVIGQTSLTSTAGCNQGGAAPTASTICQAGGLAFDSSGDLWVSDTGNMRVLEFKPPFSTGMPASLELGQPSGATAFSTATINNGGISASTLYWPNKLAFDGDGNLWIPDSGNNRVLGYVPPFSNGMAATLEMGQSSGAAAFTSHSVATSQSGLTDPIGVSFDTSGNMQVDDYANSRVMIFMPPFSNGMNATTVLGQANFTSGSINQGSIGANTLYYPIGGVTF